MAVARRINSCWQHRILETEQEQSFDHCRPARRCQQNRVRVQTRAAVVGCRNGRRAADGTHSHPELREGTYTRRTLGHIEVEKAKAFTNGSALNGAAFTGLYPAPIPTACLCSYTTRRIEPIFLSL